MTFASLAETLSMSASEVFAATKRAATCHLLVEQPAPASGIARYRPAAANLREFLTIGLRYVFPAEPGKATRGFRTAQDAPPLVT
ncbi:MAG: MarR family transcriptional regulator, partial [Verrucomicrobiota bacterium]|nr:MarR family transcriptional regulator [Verrucomicrobiota bacterium]